MFIAIAGARCIGMVESTPPGYRFCSRSGGDTPPPPNPTPLFLVMSGCEMSLQVCTATAHGGTSSPGGRAIASITTARPFLGTDEILGPFWFCLGKALPPSARVNLGPKHSLCRVTRLLSDTKEKAGKRTPPAPKPKSAHHLQARRPARTATHKRRREGTPRGEEGGGVPAAASRCISGKARAAASRPSPALTRRRGRETSPPARVRAPLPGFKGACARPSHPEPLFPRAAPSPPIPLQNQFANHRRHVLLGGVRTWGALGREHEQAARGPQV